MFKEFIKNKMPKDGKYKDENSAQKKDSSAVLPEWKDIKNDSNYAVCNHHSSCNLRIDHYS